jgi:pimeloyl-ACP methyl ester carboxylesterase
MLDSHTLRLRDGRSLGYAEHGDLSGRPVFLFHGTPGSRMLRHPDETIAHSLHARIITVDRPGFGFSDFKPHRALLDWPEDVLDLADALHIDHFAMAGFSGGGPHVAACAYKIPDRITAVALISSLSPFDSPGSYDMVWPVGFLFRMAKPAPWLLRATAWPSVRMAKRNFDTYLNSVAARLPQSDSEVLHRPEVRTIFHESLAEMFRSGTLGSAWEIGMLARPWGFRPQDIRCRVCLWHGEDDTFHKGYGLAETIPNCETHILPNQGHLLFFNHWKEILTQLLEGPRKS